MLRREAMVQPTRHQGFEKLQACTPGYTVCLRNAQTAPRKGHATQGVTLMYSRLAHEVVEFDPASQLAGTQLSGDQQPCRIP